MYPIFILGLVSVADDEKIKQKTQDEIKTEQKLTSLFWTCFTCFTLDDEKNRILILDLVP
jgi:hypothetical protein